MAARSSSDFASWRRATSRACWKQASASACDAPGCRRSKTQEQIHLVDWRRLDRPVRDGAMIVLRQKPDGSGVAWIGDSGHTMRVLSGGAAGLLRQLSRDPGAAGHRIRLFFPLGWVD
jgi:hypothetical protein